MTAGWPGCGPWTARPRGAWIWRRPGGGLAAGRAGAAGLRSGAGRVAGLRAVDRATGRSLDLAASRVVSCAGPWSRALAARFDRDPPELLRPGPARHGL